MDPVVLLVVLVTAADAEAPGTPAALSALREAVGARGDVRLRTLAPGESPESAASREGASVVLHWEENGKRAHLRVHPRTSSPGARAWFERDLGFDERDAVEERGRAVGFALVAMLPDDLARPSAPPVASPPPVAPPSDGSSKVGSLGPSETLRPSPSPAPWGELEVRGQLALAPGGFGGGVGASVGGQMFLGKTFGLHVDFALRGAVAAEVEATGSYLRAGGGLAVRGAVARDLELGGSLDVLVLREAMSHFSSDGDESVPVVEARALPGLRAEGRLAYFLTSSAAVSLGVGVETAVGKTEIFRDAKVVGSIVPVRLGVEPGVRIRF